MEHPVAGYVPAFEDADGQEDPAPEEVVDGESLPAHPGVPASVSGTPAHAATIKRSGNHA